MTKAITITSTKEDKYNHVFHRCKGNHHHRQKVTRTTITTKGKRTTGTVSEETRPPRNKDHHHQRDKNDQFHDRNQGQSPMPPMDALTTSPLTHPSPSCKDNHRHQGRKSNNHHPPKEEGQPPQRRQGHLWKLTRANHQRWRRGEKWTPQQSLLQSRATLKSCWKHDSQRRAKETVYHPRESLASVNGVVRLRLGPIGEVLTSRSLSRQDVSSNALSVEGCIL